MFTQIFNFLLRADELFWGYLGFSLIISLGCYLTLRTNFFQIRAFPHVIRTFFQEILQRTSHTRGLHPIKAFFASVGGMLGVGNVVGIVTAIQLGGPGALLWVWIAGFAGTLIKYAEIYLGLRHRVQNSQQSYDGGPMFFLKKAFGVRWIPVAVCILLCIYGAEIYQFNVVVDTLAYSWGLNRFLIAFCLLSLVLYAGIGGVSRVGKICGWIMPVFMFIYISMCIWVIGHYFSDLPSVLMNVMRSAFSGHAAIGGFAGSSMMLAIQNGMAGACYSADIGIGYDSTIQSESHTVYPERQARMAFFGVCLDNFICTLSILVVLVTGLWQTPVGNDHAPLVQMALAQHFPLVDILMPSFILILGYTTLIAYFIVGIKCARYLHPNRGPQIYIIYTICVLTFFAFFDQTHALFVMRLAGALLLIINLAGIYRLRNEVVFAHNETSAACEAGGG
ncbi:MAG: amino acid carrier protein [Chlamydiales bacterium]